MSKFTFDCPYCEQKLETDANCAGMVIVCPVCRKSFLCSDNTSASTAKPSESINLGKIATNITNKFTEVTGTEKLEGFSLKALFSEVFSKHSNEEVESYFTVGTAATTPPIGLVDTSWPRPWIFLRMLFGSVIVYLIFVLGFNKYEQFNLLPGMMMIGSFAVPFSALIFFMEVNVVRNISLYQVVRCVFFGGVVSLILTFVFHTLPGLSSLDWLGASIAGITEEPAKLFAALLVPGISKYKYKMNGLLIGAAVGTGFAAFESAGYAFTFLLFSNDVSVMEDVIFVRGILSPLGHIVWTAIAVAALWRVKRGAKFSFGMLGDSRFWPLALVSVVLHMIWNAPFELPFFGKYIIVGIIGWFVVFSLLQEGLRELRALKG